MKIKIIKINKRPLWQRIIGVNHWHVVFEFEGKQYEGNYWAGVDDPTVQNLLFDIERKLKGECNFKSLEGKSYEL